METSALQDHLDAGVAGGDAPFLVAMVADRTGVRFAGSAGDAAPGRKADTGSIFRLFSMSKAVGATAAMILIDRGKLDPDTPVETILPEFATLQVLDGYDGDRLLLRAPRTKATIRHLLTHTSGLEYEVWNARMADHVARTCAPTMLTGAKAALFLPLMSDPGARWGYGSGLDWIGQVVEAVDGRGIVDFCRDEIFGPLGMHDTRFEPEEQDADRLCAVYARREDGGFDPIDLAPPARPEIYGMGHALWGSASDYIRLLQMFLGNGAFEGAQILSRGAVEVMLADHMPGLAVTPMASVSPLSADVHLMPGARLGHSLGFVRNQEDIPGRRAAGSQTWAGVLNSHYWFDPARGIAALFMTQSLPFADARFMQRYDDFEAAVYQHCA